MLFSEKLCVLLPSISFGFTFLSQGGSLQEIAISSGYDYPTSLAISADGSVVVGTNNNGWFRWDTVSGGAQLYTGSNSGAADVSADGEVIVGYQGNYSYAWHQSFGFNQIGGEADYIQAAAISPNALYVAGVRSGAVSEAFIDGLGGIQGLGALEEGDSSFAHAVSNDGKVVGFSVGVNNGDGQAFIWSESSGMVGLGYSDSFVGDIDRYSMAWDISADGSITVGQNGGGGEDRAFIWTESGGMAELADIEGWGAVKHSSANAISGNGLVIGGISVTELDPEMKGQATLWAGGEAYDLSQLLYEQEVDVSEWDTLYSVTGVSNEVNGEYYVTGYGSIGGVDKNFVASVAIPSTQAVPEPSSTALLLFGGAIGLLRRKR